MLPVFVPIVTLVGKVVIGGGGGLLPRVKVTSRLAVPCAAEVGVTAVIVWANADDAARNATNPTSHTRPNQVLFQMLPTLFISFMWPAYDRAH